MSNNTSTFPTGIPAVDTGRLISNQFHDEPAVEGEWVMDVRYAVTDSSFSMAYATENEALTALAALVAYEGGTMTSSHHGDFTVPGCSVSDARVKAA